MRIDPRKYKTYQISSPLATHHRKATCAEVDCQAYKNGWVIFTDGLSEQDIYVATHSGRHYRAMDVDSRPALVFYPEQPCFRESTHTVPLDRPEIYRVGRGRGSLYSARQATVHTKPEHWVEDFQENQDRIIRARERG